MATYRASARAASALCDPIDPAPTLYLVGGDGQTELLLECAADRPSHGVRLPARGLRHLGNGGASLALQELEQQSQLRSRTEPGGRCRLLRLQTRRERDQRLPRREQGLAPLTTIDATVANRVPLVRSAIAFNSRWVKLRRDVASDPENAIERLQAKAPGWGD
jgi:hypothetical protein